MLEPFCLSKERKETSDIFICPFLKLQEVYFEKYTLYMKIPGGKTKKCVVATDHEQQEWNMGIPSHSFMPKLNRLKYS